MTIKDQKQSTMRKIKLMLLRLEKNTIDFIIKNRFLLLWSLFIALMTVLFSSVFLTNTNQDNVQFLKVVKSIRETQEHIYAEAQIAALNGDWKIEDKNGSYHWIKSPWDSGAKPTLDLESFKKTD